MFSTSAYNCLVVAVFWLTSTWQSHAMVAVTVELTPNFLSASTPSPPECNSTFFNDLESHLTKWVLLDATTVLLSHVSSPTGFELIQNTNTSDARRTLYYGNKASTPKTIAGICTCKRCISKKGRRIKEVAMTNNNLVVEMDQFGDRRTSSGENETIVDWLAVGKNVTNAIVPTIQDYVSVHAVGCLGDSDLLGVNITFTPDIALVTMTVAALRVSPCACDNPNSAIPGQNMYSCADGTHDYCPTLGACTATDTFNKTDLNKYCSTPDVCSCDNPNKAKPNQNRYQCLDGTNTSCPANTICTAPRLFNKSQAAQSCKSPWFYCPNGTFITAIELWAAWAVDVISSFTCSDGTQIIVNIGASGSQPFTASTAGAGFCGWQSGTFSLQTDAAAGLEFYLCNSIGSKTVVYGSSYTSLSQGHCSTGQMVAGLKTMATADGKLVSNDFLPVCGAEPICTCDTPNTGTAGHNHYTCTDGTSGWCNNNVACTATRPFNYTTLAQFCHITCTCDVPNDLYQNGYKCTDGIHSTCPGSTVCTATKLFSKTQITEYCRSPNYYCRNGTFITDISLRHESGLIAISSFTCSDKTRVITNIGGTGGSPAIASSSGAGFCGWQTGACAFRADAAAGLSLTLCNSIGSQTAVYGGTFTPLSRGNCSTGQMVVGLTAMATADGSMVSNTFLPGCGAGPTCTCDTPNTGLSGHNRYTCTDGTNGWCDDTLACTATGRINYANLAQFCHITCSCENQNRYKCTDGSIGYCPINQTCTATETFNKTHSNNACEALVLTPITDDNIQHAVTDWINNPIRATGEYGHIANWDTSSVTTMQFLFNGKTTFNDDISRWNTASVITMRAMFQGANSFNQDISRWNTSSVTNMGFMFFQATSFNGSISQWDTAQVTAMDYMFCGAKIFNADISHWNTSQVTDMNALFWGAAAFNQDLSRWNTGKVTSMDSLFKGATSFNGSISHWNTAHVKNTGSMFAWALAFNQDISLWNTAKVNSMQAMFHGATSFNSDISTWNTSKVTNMEAMFQDAIFFNQNINRWNTGQVTNMRYMFSRATSFNANISQWDTAQVTAMDFMFNGATSFNQKLCWSLPSLQNADSTFDYSNGCLVGSCLRNTDFANPWNVCQLSRTVPISDRNIRAAVTAWLSNPTTAAATHGNISEWDTSTVTDMSYLFSDSPSFNDDISKWNTSMVTNMLAMFFKAYNFNQDLSRWNTAKVTNMGAMFYEAHSFNQRITNWNTTLVTDMDWMFDGAISFRQNLCWSLESLQQIKYMFVNSNGCLIGACVRNDGIFGSLEICTVRPASARPSSRPPTLPPTARPTAELTSTTPTLKPTTRPAVTIRYPPGTCFSGSNSLEVDGRGVVAMKDLRIGDKVKDSNGRMVSVYNFGHYQPYAVSDYLQIHVHGLPRPLEVSKDHLVFVNNTAIPASTLLVGYLIDVDSSEKRCKFALVRKIAVVRRRGVYAPFTTSGTIVVSGVVASTYVTLQEDSPFLVLGRNYRTSLSMHWLSHVFQTPHRIVCSMLGMAYCRKWETYDHDGISQWVQRPYYRIYQLRHQDGTIRMAVLALSLLPAFVLGLMLYAIDGGWMYMLAAATFYCLLVYKKKKKCSPNKGANGHMRRCV